MNRISEQQASFLSCQACQSCQKIFVQLRVASWMRHYLKTIVRVGVGLEQRSQPPKSKIQNRANARQKLRGRIHRRQFHFRALKFWDQSLQISNDGFIVIQLDGCGEVCNSGVQMRRHQRTGIARNKDLFQTRLFVPRSYCSFGVKISSNSFSPGRIPL